ncbi:hypothetical protein ACFLQL_00635 [Verrucomicrobiota bacterium]
MKEERKVTGIIVKAINFTKLAEIAVEILGKVFVNPVKNVSIDPEYTGYVETKEGLYFLGEEGVGDKHPHNEHNPMEYNAYGELVDGPKSSIHRRIYPKLTFYVHDKNIKEFPIGGEYDLSIFIRTFGDRLECNYGMWWDKLGKIIK